MATQGRGKDGRKGGLRLSIDLRALQAEAVSQFQGLDPKEPGQWPLLPKLAAWVGMTLVTVVFGWIFFVGDGVNKLNAQRDLEPGLKSDFSNKLRQAINLSELRKQKLQVQEYVNQLEKQLPSRAEMDALLSDINQAGVGRGLTFESFRPGQPATRDYYAELPIAISVSGSFHELGAFMADVAGLSRIVTIDGIALRSLTETPGSAAAGANTIRPNRVLVMEATARTYRYLDPNEIATQQKARQAAQKGRK
jgi:type IV pilus assembly protein PilO